MIFLNDFLLKEHWFRRINFSFDISVNINFWPQARSEAVLVKWFSFVMLQTKSLMQHKKTEKSYPAWDYVKISSSMRKLKSLILHEKSGKSHLAWGNWSLSSPFFKLDQTWSNWIKMHQIGLNLIQIDQTIWTPGDTHGCPGTPRDAQKCPNCPDALRCLQHIDVQCPVKSALLPARGHVTVYLYVSCKYRPIFDTSTFLRLKKKS